MKKYIQNYPNVLSGNEIPTWQDKPINTCILKGNKIPCWKEHSADIYQRITQNLLFKYHFP